MRIINIISLVLAVTFVVIHGDIADAKEGTEIVRNKLGFIFGYLIPVLYNCGYLIYNGVTKHMPEWVMIPAWVTFGIFAIDSGILVIAMIVSEYLDKKKGDGE